MAKGGDVKARILEVAAQLFMEQGYAATSVREIGEHASVGQSSLYHHVQSKGQLLYELHHAFSLDLIDRLTAVIESKPSPTDQLRGLIHVVLGVVETHQAEVTVFLREGHALPEDARKDIQRERDQVDALVDKIISDGIEAGELREDLDVRLTRLGILGLTNWSYQWLRPGGERTSAEIADYFADLVVNGVAAR
ncbi:TetR/AcrR family transcriptional regulator [Actinomadura sp. KC345]|uniref:TetR/AcrR family transcriptional regulator n=1 Tax=Actinomadura sp. KC345 TaxID=2530371 RepID=UPI00104CAF7F|nr:TetR/AcrR family transcriptional regulator [Actinomadura sp. KC345]TDC58564.1 TetR/AcrR family transcriptional regulator [Actinomadura sp. KC345]